MAQTMIDPSVTRPSVYDPNHLDGVLALQILMSQDFPLEIYPRQLVLLRSSGESGSLFTHGVPDTTLLTSAMTVQHKRMRRALLRRRDIRIPLGATFPSGSGLPRAKRFADRLDYNLVVKPAVGDPGKYMFSDVYDEDDLENAIWELKTPIHQ